MVTGLCRNVINDFRSMYLSGDVSNLDGNEERAYQLYLNIVSMLNEEQHKCIGCPIILRTYQMKDNSQMEYLYSNEQDECIDHVMQCTNVVADLDGLNVYGTFLDLINKMEK